MTKPIILTIHKGEVGVSGLPPGQRLEVHDYEVEGVEGPNLEVDKEGDTYLLTVYEGEQEG